jgi:aryl-alcohol dehydrogenase-like predicted oxidoreductase
MEYRNLGHSGLQVSLLGLGGNNFGRQVNAAETAAIVDRCIDYGITFFDSADVYGNRGGGEECLGAALKRHRRNVVLATKAAGSMGEGPYWSGASRRYLMDAVEASLRRLDTDYIDLYYVHFPDPRTPIEETLRALDDMVRSGKVRYIGCSNFSAWQVVEAAWTSRTQHLAPFIAAQNQYSLLDRRIESQFAPACQRYGLGVVPFYPLASGLLTGKYRPGETPEGSRLSRNLPIYSGVLERANFDTITALQKFAEDRGHTLIELALGWLASQPFVSSIIAGATRPEQLEENARSLDWRLTPEELAEVDDITGREEPRARP